MDLKKAECKKQGHCYSKREEARPGTPRRLTLISPQENFFPVLSETQ